MGKIADFSAWLLAKGTSPTTADLYCRILRDYIQYNGRDTPDERSVSDWTRELIRTNSPRTVNLKLSAVAKFCAFCGVHIRINRPKVQKRLYIDHLLTLDEVQMLISGLAADGHKRLAVIALLLAKSGGRVSEIIRLRKSDLERGYADMDTKGKVRRIYLPTPLRKELAPYTDQLRSDDYLCRNRYGRQITARGAAMMLREYAGRIGIPPEKVHPHAFRHFYAVRLYKETGDINLVADELGHADVRTTMIYLQKTEEEQRAEVDKAFTWEDKNAE